jgi:hypothetical protein
MSDRHLRWATHGAVVLALGLLCVLDGPAARAEEDYVYTAADTLAAIDEAAADSGVSYRRLYLIVRCETGGTFDPYSIGRLGEKGAVQLYSRGELPRFYAYGFDNPFSPYQAVAFLAQRLNEGGARAWTCA